MIDMCFSDPSASAGQTIDDCLVVGQAIDGGSDERVILFVKLPDDQKLSASLERKIKGEVRSRRSPRHVPARVSCPRRRPRSGTSLMHSLRRSFRSPISHTRLMVNAWKYW